jgi:hypothetical protein
MAFMNSLPLTDPMQDPRQKLIQALLAGGGDPTQTPSGALPWSGAPTGAGAGEPGGIAGTLPGAAPSTPADRTVGATTEAPKATTDTGVVTPGTSPASAGTSGGYDFSLPAGFDPSNATDKFVLDHFQKYLSRAKSGDPGAQPTLENMSYWRDKINQGGGPSDYWDHRMTPGDPSNAPGVNGGGSGGANSGLINPLSLVPGAGLPNLSGQDPADSILARIMQALTQYGGV